MRAVGDIARALGRAPRDIGYAGLKDADEGRTAPHDEVFEEFSNDAHPVD